MPPNRTSRTRGIPENLIVNWRISDLSDGAKPLLRRPPTACDACRAAKAKCSGQRDCGRCTERGLACTYSSQVTPNRLPLLGDSDQPPSIGVAWHTLDVPAETPVIPSADPAVAQDSPNELEHQARTGLETISPADWMDEIQGQSIHHPGCGPLDPALHVRLHETTLSLRSRGADFPNYVAAIFRVIFSSSPIDR